MRRFVIPDREGTLIMERHCLSAPGQMDPVPGAAAALRDLAAMGLGRIVATGRSVVGRVIRQLCAGTERTEAL